MAVKILIQRKVKPGKEKELNETVKELRSGACCLQLTYLIAGVTK